jgi:hypothetical protein
VRSPPGLSLVAGLHVGLWSWRSTRAAARRAVISPWLATSTGRSHRCCRILLEQPRPSSCAGQLTVESMCVSWTASRARAPIAAHKRGTGPPICKARWTWGFGAAYAFARQHLDITWAVEDQFRVCRCKLTQERTPATARVFDQPLVAQSRCCGEPILERRTSELGRSRYLNGGFV